MLTSALVAIFVVVATICVAWYVAGLLSALSWDRNAIWSKLAAYVFIYGELLTCAVLYLRLSLVRYARARHVARVLAVENDPGACKLGVPLDNVAGVEACRCSGFECMRKMGGVSGLLFYA